MFVANYIALLCPKFFRLVLEALLKEGLPKQREAWVIDRKAVEATQKSLVLQMLNWY
jgi:hypothetical protein